MNNTQIMLWNRFYEKARENGFSKAKAVIFADAQLLKIYSQQVKPCKPKSQ